MKAQVRLVALVREGAALARRGGRASAALALTVTLVVSVVLTTTGRTAAAENTVVVAIESLGARLVVITDAEREAGIHAVSVERIAAIDGVEWAFGLGAAERGGIADGRPGVSVRPIVGASTAPITLTGGRWPAAPGEAIAGERAVAALGLGDVAGPVPVGDGSVGVVGQMTSIGVLDFLNDTVAVVPRTETKQEVVQIYFSVRDPAAAPAIGEEARALMVREGTGPVVIEVSASVIDLSRVVSGELGHSGRQLMLMVLAVGLVLTAAVTLAMCSAERRNFGRMRALGATRSALVLMVLTAVGLTTAAAAVVGMAAGLVIVGVFLGEEIPPATFATGVAIAAWVTALAGSVVPAITAARRDPVLILRVP